MGPVGVYHARLLFAGLVAVSLVLRGVLYESGDRIPGSDDVGGYTTLWIGLCGVGLSVTSIGWLVTTEDPIAVDHLGAVLGALYVASLAYETYAAQTDHSRSDLLTHASLCTLALSLLASTLLVLLQPRVDVGRVYTARVVFAALIPVALVAVFGVGRYLLGPVGGDMPGLGLSVVLVFVVGLSGVGLSTASVGWIVTVGEFVALDYLEAVLSVSLVLSFAGSVHVYLTDFPESNPLVYPTLVTFAGSLVGTVLLVLARHAARVAG